MPAAVIPRRLYAFLRSARACRRGVSGVEFALVAPVLMVLFIGSVDLSRAVTASNRAGYVADSIAELVSQANATLTDDQINAFILSAPLIDADILSYGRQIQSTDLPRLVNVTISSVAFSKTSASCTANCTYAAATVFSRALSGSARACGPLLAVPDATATTPLTLPTSAFGPVSLVVVDVEVFFKPLFLTALPFPGKFRRSAYFRPRQIPQINASLNCTGF